MRTVASLCASGAGISLSAVGLTLARPEDRDPRCTLHPPTQDTDMTAVATYTFPTLDARTAPADYSHYRPPTAPPTSRAPHLLGGYGRSFSDNSTEGPRRSIATPRASLGMDGVLRNNEAGSSPTALQPGPPPSRPRSFLRRWSSSMNASRDSSRAPTSRAGSTAVSYSNGSVAFSNAESTTPMFGERDTPPAPPSRNKLVKRTSSVRSANGSPYSSSPGSRLPVPVFRRPATSHQRSATMQYSLVTPSETPSPTVGTDTPNARDPQWRHYFTPRVAMDELTSGRRRNSTGIPNPIRRVYPDRKYTPVLVSGKELVRPAPVEPDCGLDAEYDAVTTRSTMTPAVASSPTLPEQPAPAEAKRSFSIGDLLSTGPQPLWRRPTTSKGRPSSSKLVRKSRARVGSAPQAPMGSSFSNIATQDFERSAKRRDLTDPQAAHRSIYSSSSSKHPADSHHQDHNLDLIATTPQSQHFSVTDLLPAEPPIATSSPLPLEQRSPPAVSVEPPQVQPSRVSATPSEILSTAGSDSDRRSTGAYSTDYQSDTAYDSIPTQTTRSASGKRGPPIDTIFDDSPPVFSTDRSTRLGDLLSDGHFPGGGSGGKHRHSTIEEEGSIISTPVRSLRNSVTSTPSARPGAQQIFNSSPPAMSVMPDFDDMDWDAPDEKPAGTLAPGIRPPEGDSPFNFAPPTSFPHQFGAFSRSANAASAQSTPNHYGNLGTDRSNLFDWSEQQPSPSHPNQSPPRPRTVHGKKDPENRGSRASGRRAPSGMHARSHSVPVVPDVDGKRNVVANKFGTWGVGSKAVTEDWNEDFDFEEPVPSLPKPVAMDEKRIDSGHEMFVPKSIREQQENVVANISLLREWGLLIEELKDLRMRAVALDMLHGAFAQDWQEVDAMIELADQESEEHTLQPRRSPPSSPGFDFSAFDEPSTEDSANGRPGAISPMRLADSASDGDMDTTTNGTIPQPHAVHSGSPTRPRKSSEAVARTVIEALQSRRGSSDPKRLKSGTSTKKVPFDTGTLRHIVPYVNGLKRKVKDALRETEGLYVSPKRQFPQTNGNDTDYDNDDDDDDDTDDEPAFRSIFNDPIQASPTQPRKMRRDLASTDNDDFGEPLELRDDLARRMQNMTLPP